MESLGGDRLHSNYANGRSQEMMAALRLERPTDADYEAVHQIASDTVGGPLAPVNEIRRVDAMISSAIWVVRRHGQVAGFLAPLALTKAGRDALIEDTFDAGNIERQWVAPLGAPLAGFYCWCYAGRDQVARGALVMALRKLINDCFPDLPFFGRDTTAAGAKIMSHLGFAPYDAAPHLYWRCRSLMDDAQ